MELVTNYNCYIYKQINNLNNMITNTNFKIRYNTPEGKSKWFNCVQIEKGTKPKSSNEMYLHEDTISQLLELNNLIINFVGITNNV